MNITQSTKNYLIDSILNWIFNSYTVTNETPPDARDVRDRCLLSEVAKMENSFVFGFSNTCGDPANVIITFEEKLMSEVQDVIDEKQEDLLNFYLERIKEFIIMSCIAQVENGKTVWLIASEIFEPPRLQ